jgi:hypothetical protein
MKQKRGFFASRKQFRDFRAKCFCSIYIIFLLQWIVFCCIGTFIEAKAGLRRTRWTRVSRRSRRIAGQILRRTLSPLLLVFVCRGYSLLNLGCILGLVKVKFYKIIFFIISNNIIWIYISGWF